MQINRRQMFTLAAALPALGFSAKAVLAETKSKYYAEDGIAIDGSDPVAYFTESKPVAGDPAITHDWEGVTWRFASAANKDSFIANPESYAPQYGGYCAWAVSEGYTASTTPNAWRVEGGKLYLNYSRRIQRRWEKDIPGNISRANANWPGVL